MSLTALPTPQSVERESGAVAVGSRSSVRFADAVPADLRDALTKILSRGDGSAFVELSHSSEWPAEGYEFLADANGVRMAAADRAGFTYAIRRLEQVMNRGRVPLGRIRDFPSLCVRGFHVNFSALRHMGFKEALNVLDAMARWNLNTALFEYGDRYPYGKHKAICAADALERDQLQALLAHARSLGIEPIPLHQCLGHVDFILRHDEYAHLREEEEWSDQWCPLKPESFDLFRECVDDVIEAHSDLRYFHLGGDEARRLGHCPECAKVAEKHGTGRLYLDFVVRAIEYVKAQGLIPIIWDDMLCRHTEVLDEVPRCAVIMYWEYWTTQNPSAAFVCRPAGKGIILDRRWETEWANRLDPVERRMIEHFGKAIDLEGDLSPAYLARFGKYLGERFPERVRAFPYLEYYQDLGFQVMGAPAGGSNSSTWRALPDFPRYADNINVFCRRAHEAGALGVVTSSWFDWPVDTLVPAIMYTGQWAWNISTAAEAT
jgi:hexosaminidase